MIKVSDIVQAEKYLLKRLKRMKVLYTLCQPNFSVYDFMKENTDTVMIWFNTSDRSTHSIMVHCKIVDNNNVKEYLKKGKA